MSAKKKQTNCRALKRVIVYDNNGKTADRYSIFLDGSVYAMSNHPFHPQGFCQYAGEASELAPPGKHLGKKISVKKLPDDVKAAICDRAIRDVIIK